jgi:hypothetical protein
MTTPSPKGRAFFDPGGFSLHEGASVAEPERIRRLALVFARELLRGWFARLFAAGFLLPAIGIGIYALVRAKFGAFALPVGEQAAFVLKNLLLLFRINLGALLLAAAARIAPLVARDAWSGALLLYFSRPVLRGHYLLARTAATAGVAMILLAIPGLLLLVLFVSIFGLQPGGAPGPAWAGPLLWPALTVVILLGSLLMSVAVALVGLACGVVVRSPSSAPLLLGGGLFASLVLSWVMQAAWGRDTVARAVDLHQALVGILDLLLVPLTVGAVAKVQVLQDLSGLALWTGLALGAWALLRRFLANPPLGKGRA